MANLDFSVASLMPKARAPAKPRPAFKETADPFNVPTHCDCCGGVLPIGRKGTRKNLPAFFASDFGPACHHCVGFFGLVSVFGHMPGCTDFDPKQAKSRIDALREAQYGMVLRSGTFGAPDGTMLTVEMGDVIRVICPKPVAGNIACGREHSMSQFTVKVPIGDYPLTLFPHEISPIGFIRVMELRKAGELEEAYVSQDDEHGHFRPTADVRAQIDATFGVR